MNSFS